MTWLCRGREGAAGSGLEGDDTVQVKACTSPQLEAAGAGIVYHEGCQAGAVVWSQERGRLAPWPL